MPELAPRYTASADLTGGGPGSLQISGTPSHELVVQLAPFFVGPPGPSGAEAGISSSAGNALTTGEDGGLFVPTDIASDPLAYYILAKN